MKCKVSAPAKHDLDEIWNYIAADDPIAADRHLERIVEAYEKLARMPMLGTSRNRLARSLRSIPFRNYLIFYRVQSSEVEIVRVIEGHRNISEEFFK